MKKRSLKQTYALLMATVFTYSVCPGTLRAQESEESERISYLEEQMRTLVGKMEEVQHELKVMKEAAASTPAPTPHGEPHGKSDLSQDHETVDTQTDDSDDEEEHTLPTGTAQEAYDHAVSLLNKQEYAKAEKALKAFIKKHPKNALVVNAQYWIGETYLLRKEYKDAALHFASAYKTYKAESSDKKKHGKQSFAKAPEALIKLAFSLKGMGKRKEASATLAQLHKEFPHLSNNLSRLAEKAQTGL